MHWPRRNETIPSAGSAAGVASSTLPLLLLLLLLLILLHTHLSLPLVPTTSRAAALAATAATTVGGDDLLTPTSSTCELLRFLTFVRLVDRAAAAFTPPVLDVTPTPRLVDDNVVVDDDADEKRRAISSTGQDVKCHTLASLLVVWCLWLWL